MSSESDSTASAAVASMASVAPVQSDIKIPNTTASASSSKSTSPTDSVSASAESSSTSSSPNTINTADNTDHNETSLMDADAKTSSDSKTANQNSLNDTTDKYYITRLISGDEILLPRKEILIAVLKEYAAEKKTEEEKIKGEVEASGKQVTSADEEVAAAEEALRAAEKMVKEANEKRGIAILKDTELKERALKAKLVVEDVEVQLNDAEDAPVAAIAGFLEKVQNSSKEGAEVEVKGVDGNGKNGGKGVGKDQDVGQQTPVAGKRKREGDDSSDEHDEPPSKERNLDESQENGGVKLPEGAEIDEDFGIVFNSPFRPNMELQHNDSDNISKFNNASANEISIKASLLRPFVFEAINQRRVSEGREPVPLLELIFMVNREGVESLEDDDVVSESVLLGDEVTIGVKHFPEISLEKIMKPFLVLSQALVREEAEQSNSPDSTSSGVADPTNKTKWWRGVQRDNGITINLSERAAAKAVALALSAPGTFGVEQLVKDGRYLIPAFFNQYLADIDSQFSSRFFFWQSFSFPSAKAFDIAHFQLSDSEKTPANLLRLFPKYSFSLISGLVAYVLLRKHFEDNILVGHDAVPYGEPDIDGTVYLQRDVENMFAHLYDTPAVEGMFCKKDREESVSAEEERLSFLKHVRKLECIKTRCSWP